MSPQEGAEMENLSPGGQTIEAVGKGLRRPREMVENLHLRDGIQGNVKGYVRPITRGGV